MRLDFGTSALYQRPVSALVGERAANTALLASASLLLALALGLPAAFVTATRPRSIAARVIRVLSLLLVSVPPFVGSLVLVLFASWTTWLPAGGMTSGSDLTGIPFVLDVLRHLPLPVLALALPLAGTFERLQAQALAAALPSRSCTRRARAAFPSRSCCGVTRGGCRSSRWPASGGSRSARC